MTAPARRFEPIPEDPVPACPHPLAWRRYDGEGQPYCERCGLPLNPPAVAP